MRTLLYFLLGFAFGDVSALRAGSVYEPYAITTVAGFAAARGSSDGPPKRAQFSTPEGTAVDRAGNVYVADYFNSTIRKITPKGVVSTLAGTAGKFGTADGQGAAARFGNPRGIAVAPDGTL